MAVAVAVLVIIAGVAYLRNSASPTPAANPYPAPSGWVTFSSAWKALNVALTDVPGNFSSLVYVQGVGANRPWSPPLGWYWVDGFAPIRGCNSLLSGPSVITFWNDSAYPYSTSPTALRSGTAPLWTVVARNSAGDFAVASWINGTVLLNGMVPAGSDCSRLIAFSNRSVTLPAGDSDAAMRALLDRTGSNFRPWDGVDSATPPWLNQSPQFATYTVGPTLGSGFSSYSFDGSNDWTIGFGSCGAYGTPLRSPEYYWPPPPSAGGSSLVMGTASALCFSSAIAFDLENTSSWTSPNGSSYFHEFSFTNVTFTSSEIPWKASLNDFNVSLLTPTVEMQSGPGGYLMLAPTAALCNSSVASPAECPPVAQGWYAVLFSAAGAWLDGFMSTGSESGWLIPNVGVVAGDLLLIVDASAHLGAGTVSLSGGAELQARGSAYLCLGPLAPGCR